MSSMRDGMNGSKLYFSFLSEFGTGYVPAVINSATEFKFIHRMLAWAGSIGSFFLVDQHMQQ